MTPSSRSNLPLPMTMRWSAVRAISFIRWLETRTVRPSAAKAAHQVANPDDAFGIETVDRLVEHQHGRVAEQRGGDAEPLAHPQREAADAAIGGDVEPDDAEHLVDACCEGWRCSARGSAGD